MDREEYKRTSLENWQTMASGWERRRADIESTSRPVTDWMLAALDAQPGDTVLELAAGPGDVGFAVTARLGSDGRLISSDFSSEMVEVARRRAGELGLRNVEHRVMDAEAMDLDDESVDGVLCRWGFMLMPDPRRALAETSRVLRNGGRLVLAVWSTPDRNPWVAVGGRILAGLELSPPPRPGEPGMFVLADEGRLRGLLEDVGLKVERVEDVPVVSPYASIDEYITATRDMGGMFSRLWDAATVAQREEIRAGLADGFAPFAIDGGYALPGVSLCASAVKRGR